MLTTDFLCRQRLHNIIADIETLNHNEDRLLNMMAVR